MTGRDGLIERVAKAMFEEDERRAIQASEELCLDPSMWLTWETANELTRAPYRKTARVALEAADIEALQARVVELEGIIAALVECHIKRGPFDEPLGESEQAPSINRGVAVLANQGERP